MASSTMAMLILFVVSNFFAHINRIMNAGFLVDKTLVTSRNLPKKCRK